MMPRPALNTYATLLLSSMLLFTSCNSAVPPTSGAATAPESEARVTPQYYDDEYDVTVSRSVADERIAGLGMSYNQYINFCLNSPDACRSNTEKLVLLARSELSSKVFDGFTTCEGYNNRRLLELERKRVLFTKMAGGLVIMTASGSAGYGLGTLVARHYNTTNGWVTTGFTMGSTLVLSGIFQPLFNRFVERKLAIVGAPGQPMDLQQAARVAQFAVAANAARNLAAESVNSYYSAQDCINDVEGGIVAPGEL